MEALLAIQSLLDIMVLRSKVGVTKRDKVRNKTVREQYEEQPLLDGIERIRGAYGWIFMKS